MGFRVPSLRAHKGSWQAVCVIHGKSFYLGRLDAKGRPTKESKHKYGRLIAEFVSTGCSPIFGQAPESLSMAEVCESYLQHREHLPGDRMELANVVRACEPISELYSELPANQFGPLQFKACREWWLKDKKRSRRYINSQMARVRRLIKWAVAEGIVPSHCFEAIRCVDPVKKGHTEAAEPAPIGPVSDSAIEATIPHLSDVVADMVRFQRVTGCRPGEVCKIKPSMVNRAGDVWEIQFAEHKGAWRGMDRVVYVGPKAQAVLIKYLDRDGYCFSPRESIQQLRSKRKRETPLNQGNRPGYSKRRRERRKALREPRECFTTPTYGRAIKYACAKAFPAPKHLSDEEKKAWNRSHAWAPNQIRHLRATEIRKGYGLEAAASVLGHSEIGVTQVYAEADRDRAMRVARETG